jgi:hypothetical protein
MGGGGSGEPPAEAPGWTGGGELSLVAAASLPTAAPAGSTVTSLALDGDTLLAGHTDGSVAVWRLSGMDPLSSLLAWPAARPRPDALLRPPTGGGPVTSLAVSRDDDVAVVGGEGEAWVFELARGRPLQHVRLAAVGGGGGAGGGAGSYSSGGSSSASPPLLTTPVCAAACVTADGGVVIAATAAVMRQVAAAGGAEGGGSGSGGVPILRPVAHVTELLLFGPDATAGPAHGAAQHPLARVCLPARVACVHRVRGGGVGDVEGAGALVAVGRGDGVVALYDGRDLALLAEWATPGGAGVFCLDASPCGGYLVAGCANGVVAAFALPALPVALPVPPPTAAGRDDDGGAGGGGGGGGGGGDAGGAAGSLSQGAVAAAAHGVERAKGLARSATAAAASGVKGLFGGMFGAKK